MALILALLLVSIRPATSAVLKMPKPLPDIVKSYKSVYIHAGSTGMNNTFVQVKPGDYITILAKGTIDLGKGRVHGPKVLLSYQFSEEDVERRYRGPDLITIYPGYLKNRESGNIYLSYGDRYRCPSFHQGYFLVDIIFWKMNDPNLVAKFLEEASSAKPKDNDLKEIVQEFKKGETTGQIILGVVK